MSLITRCPTCQTLFKVVPDQLRISEGWVRCGSCEAIFDAPLHRLPDAVQAAPPSALPAAPESLSANGDCPGTVPEVAHALPDQTLSPEPDSTGTDGPAHFTEPQVATFLNIEPAVTRPTKALRHYLLGSLVLALLVALLGQIVFHERDRIVVLQPALRSWLVAFCLPLKCQVSALRQKDSIAIERASFSKITGNTYRLNFTVKNTAAVAVAAPAIELTLTDTSDQAVLRRVFLPAELDLKSDTLPAAAEWSASLVVTADLADSMLQTVGYRVYAFYP